MALLCTWDHGRYLYRHFLRSTKVACPIPLSTRHPANFIILSVILSTSFGHYNFEIVFERITLYTHRNKGFRTECFDIIVAKSLRLHLAGRTLKIFCDDQAKTKWSPMVNSTFGISSTILNSREMFMFCFCSKVKENFRIVQFIIAWLLVADRD